MYYYYKLGIKCFAKLRSAFFLRTVLYIREQEFPTNQG